VVDRRADIWAFGVVLFEMLSARSLFGGETVADTLAKVLERPPDWRQLPPDTPRPLRKLIEQCLKKDPKERLQAIGDARTLIQEWIADPETLAVEPEAPVYPRWKKLAAWAAAPLFLAAGFFLKPSPAPPARELALFEYVLPGSQLFEDFFAADEHQAMYRTRIGDDDHRGRIRSNSALSRSRSASSYFKNPRCSLRNASVSKNDKPRSIPTCPRLNAPER
jgi:serine/threonine protein kinase